MGDSSWTHPDGYAAGQLARAFVTSLTHEDAPTRERATRRSGRWAAALRAMAEGRVVVGGRSPVADLPAWATPEVLRGGFATGDAVAGGPLTAHEAALAAEVGVPAGRAALFDHHLTEAGLARLWALLDGGRYRVTTPEEAALPVVALLVRAGAIPEALALVDELRPYADRLRFLPEPAATPAPDPSVVSREPVGQVRAALAARRPNRRVATQSEALTVWNPLLDEFVRLWRDEGEPGWSVRATALVERYHRLAAEHPLTRRHRDPHGNLHVLRTATEQALTGELDPRRHGLARARVAAAVRRRGEPGSDRHAALRSAQAAQAARPPHHLLARIAADRLSGLPGEGVLDDPAPFARPAEAGEAPGVAAGTPLPPPVHRALARAVGAPIAELVARGIVPSGEVLAALVPRITAAAIAGAYPDPATRALVASTETAFRSRRSVLIMDLSSQVRADELPWLRALGPYRRAGGGVDADLRGALTTLATLALDAFPATILPNPLVDQLRSLARAAGMVLPWVAEIAADIFTGRFVQAFPDAAAQAAWLLAGTPYARYYALGEPARTPEAFALRCRERAGVDGGRWSVAANGRVLEQAQILTTHDLALLAGPLRVVPTAGWEDAAHRAYARAATLLAAAGRAESPLRVIKNAAYAWRQAVFHLSLAGPEAQRRFPDWEAAQPVRMPAAVRRGLATALDGGTPADPFLGWTLGPHPLLSVPHGP